MDSKPASGEPQAADPSRPIDDARHFAACGLPVLPAGERCGRLLVPRSEATTCVAIVEAWWGKWPHAAVAIDTGPRSIALALEIFGTLGERTLIDLQRRHGELPCTPLEITGDDFRILIFARAARFIVRRSLGPGLSLISTGDRISRVLRRRRPGLRVIDHIVVPPLACKAVAS